MVFQWPPTDRRQHVTMLAIVVAGIALISAAQLHHNWTAFGIEVGFASLLLMKLTEWSLWGVAVPAIVWLDRAQGFQRRPRPSALFVHLVAAILWFLAMNVVLTILTSAIDPSAADSTFRRLYTNRLIFKLPAGLGVYAFILAAYGIVHLASRHNAQSVREAQLQNQLSAAQLRNLQMQLQPHFLFNALHSIGGLVREGEGERAVDMIAELSDLLRRALGTADRQQVTLDEELDFLDQYVRIQQVRFGDRLRVCYQFEPAVRSLLIPALMLQPLVENAIRHGLERTTREVEVTIGIRAVEDRLLIEVSDTGPGPATSPVVERVGMGTTRQRLVQLYGTQQTFTLEPRPEGGTVVRMTLPRRSRSTEDA